MKTFHPAQTIKQKGFTLIELLVVIAIISALTVLVFVALKPGQRLQDARDARRATDVDTLLTAIHSYIVDNKSALPTGLSKGMLETQIGTAGSGCAISAGGCGATSSACVDLSTPLASYLKSMPADPSTGDSTKTGYTVVVDNNNIVTVKACGVEDTTSLSASR